MHEKGFSTLTLLVVGILLIGIVFGTRLVQMDQLLPSQAAGNKADLKETTVECLNNTAVVHLRMHIPYEFTSYEIKRYSPTDQPKLLYTYKKNDGSSNHWYAPDKYDFEDYEAKQGTEYTYVLSTSTNEEAEVTINTPDCSIEQNSCNGTFCLKLRERGCSGKFPYYMLEWSPGNERQFDYYMVMRDSKQQGGSITQVTQTSMIDTADQNPAHTYYIKMIKKDGGETKTGTLTLYNKCL